MEGFKTTMVNRSQFTALVKAFLGKFSDSHCNEMFKLLAKPKSENRSSLKKDG